MPRYNFNYNPILVKRAKELRQNMTVGEKVVWFKILGNKNLKGLRWQKQQPIGNYIVDFYCPQLRLVIEIDGDSHVGKEQKDAYRTKVLEADFKLRIIRYQDTDVIENTDGVVEDLLRRIPPTPLGEGGIEPNSLGEGGIEPNSLGEGGD